MSICKVSETLSDNYLLNFTEDRENVSCRVLHEGRGLETGHKSGQSLCFSLSPSSNTPSKSSTLTLFKAMQSVYHGSKELPVSRGRNIWEKNA